MMGDPAPRLYPSGLKRNGLLLLGVMVVLSYANSLWNGFVYDDQYLVVRNGLITHVETLPKLLTSDYWITRKDPNGEKAAPSGLYRPLIHLSYAMNYAAGGLEPFGYHLVNLVLHGIVTFLVYSLALRMGFEWSGAIGGAALFAVHPLHTEAVANVAGRAELLMAACVLGSLWCAAQRLYVWSWTLFAAGLFSKEQAIMLPALVILQDWCLARGITSPNQEGGGRRYFLSWPVSLRYVGYGAVLAVCLVVRYSVMGVLAPPPTPFLDNPLAAHEGFARLVNVVKVDGLYLWRFLWPAVLSADYSYNAIPSAQSSTEPAVLWGWVAWGGVLIGLAYAFVRAHYRAAFCLGLMVLTFFPVSNLAVSIGTVMGERLFYLPSAGLCLLAGLGWQFLLTGRPWRSRFAQAAVAGGVAVIFLLGARTVIRNQDWRSSETVFESAYRVYPQSARVQVEMGLLSASKKDWAASDRAFAEAIRIYPTYLLTDGEVLGKYAGVLLARDESKRALEILERAEMLERDNQIIQFNLGLAYARLGRYQEAETAYRRTLAIDSDSAEAYNGLSYVLIQEGQYELALEMALEALRRQDTFVEAHFNSGRALEKLGRPVEAVKAYKRVIELAPDEIKLRSRIARLEESLAGSTGLPPKRENTLRKEGGGAMEKPRS